MNPWIKTQTIRYVPLTGIFILLCGIALMVPVSAAVLTASQFGAASNPTGNPIGGGTGYSDIKTSGDYIVTTAAELTTALRKATPGQVIYIPDSANIDLTGIHDTALPAGVTIASDRGYNGNAGGRIFQNRISSETSDSRMLVVSGNNVRITGLRIEGSDKTTNTVASEKVGIHLDNHGGLVVDNCEIYGWSNAGIAIGVTNAGLVAQGLADSEIGSSIANIHHNYIHNNQEEGYGYGIAHGDGSSLIKANVFANNRHSVESEGRTTDGYEASYNVIINAQPDNDAVFDSHGYPNDGDTSSNLIRIHHNTVLKALAQAVQIRGTSQNMTYIYNNWFLTCGQSGTIHCIDAGSSPNSVVQFGGTTKITMTNNLLSEILYQTGVVFHHA